MNFRIIHKNVVAADVLLLLMFFFLKDFVNEYCFGEKGLEGYIGGSLQIEDISVAGGIFFLVIYFLSLVCFFTAPSEVKETKERGERKAVVLLLAVALNLIGGTGIAVLLENVVPEEVEWLFLIGVLVVFLMIVILPFFLWLKYTEKEIEGPFLSGKSRFFLLVPMVFYCSVYAVTAVRGYFMTNDPSRFGTWIWLGLFSVPLFLVFYVFPRYFAFGPYTEQNKWRNYISSYLIFLLGILSEIDIV